VNQEPILGRLLKKTRGRQSRATAPLSKHNAVEVELNLVTVVRSNETVISFYHLEGLSSGL
jgi:hypothetical protein